MGIVNSGTQHISWDFKYDAKGSTFSRTWRNLIKPGIYKGGLCTKTGANTISIAPLVAFLNVGADKAIRLQTSSIVNLTVNSSNPIVYIKYDWYDVIENYADFLIRTEGSPVANEVVLVKVLFNSGGEITGFDYNEQDRGLFDENFNVRIDKDLSIRGDALIEGDVNIEGALEVTGGIKSLQTPSELYDVINLAFGDSRYLRRDVLVDDLLEDLKDRMDAADLKNLGQEIRLNYLEGRKQTTSSSVIETFINDYNYSNDYENNSNKLAEILDDNDYNNNWNYRKDKSPTFKNGFMRQRAQSYMLEPLEEYTLEAVGQTLKGSISKYDSVNDCYWMISSSGVAATSVGEISKISPYMKDGQLVVLARYYLPTSGTANLVWSGIDCDSDGTKLWFVLRGSSLTTSKVYGIVINTDGTLGASGYTVANGGTISLTNSIYASYTISASGYDSGYYTDVIEWDDSTIMVLACTNASYTSLIRLDKSNLGNSASADILGFEKYVQAATAIPIGITAWTDRVHLYMRINEPTNDTRLIYKFNISSDIVSNICMTSSGRFNCYRPYDSDFNEGITVSKFGDILEVVSTASNGKLLVKRSLKNALWAENQINFNFRMNAATNPSTPYACMVEDNRYLWTGDYNTTTTQVDIYRFDPQTNTHKHVRIANTGFISLYDLTYNPNTGILYLLVGTASALTIYYGSLSSFIALMGDTFNASNTKTLASDWGSTASGFTAITTVLYGICYDEDDDLILILNDATDKIDTLSLDGATYSTGVYDLPAPTVYWQGIAYKNGKIYIRDATNTTTCSKIYVIDKEVSTASQWYKLHVYMDAAPSFVAAGSKGIDFKNNDLISVHATNIAFYGNKILEDPDVVQLHTFLDSYNVLLSSFVTCSTGIAERYFKPEEFSDARNIPDQFYCAVGYGDNGWSELHLDEFLSNKSTSGLPRYDVRKIRTRHYKKGSSYLTLFTGTLGNVSKYVTAICIEKDMIFIANDRDSDNINLVHMVDLKKGSVGCFSTYSTSPDSGIKWGASLTDRNVDTGVTPYNYVGTYNAELDLTQTTTGYLINGITARTFFREDASDYNFKNPKTYVAISTLGGTDLLVIDWDDNNDRLPVKVWNNIWNLATLGGYTPCFIAPSGFMFAGSETVTNSLFKSNVPVWELNADAGFSYADSTLSTQIGSNIIAAFIREPKLFACWKTASGEWRHILLVSTIESGTTGFTSLHLVDVEKVTVEALYKYDYAASNGIFSTDSFEDTIFATFNTGGSAWLFAGIAMFKKQRINSKFYPGYLNNKWSPKQGGWISSLLDATRCCRPYFTILPAGTAATSAYYYPAIKHAKFFNFLIFCTGTSFGLQLFHMPYMNETSLETIEGELDYNPKSLQFIQSTLTPYNGEVE